MRRRRFLAALGSAGLAGVAGCGALESTTTIAGPTVDADSPQRRTLTFTDDEGEVGTLGVDAEADRGVIHLGTEITHREGTTVESIALRVWMPPDESDATLAIDARIELASGGLRSDRFVLDGRLDLPFPTLAEE